MADSADAMLCQWRDDLAAWAIPEEIRQAAGRSPWELPRNVFANRARLALAAPSGISYEQASRALPDGGAVIDVGCGAGAASLPLAGAGLITGVDADSGMLATFAELASGAGRRVEVVAGRWPDVARRVPVADVVLCHHVLYNVADLAPFVLELTRHARRQVVVELTARHPMSDLNPLWQRLHGCSRPERPVAEDALAAIWAMGLDARSRTWSRPAQVEFDSYQEMLDITGRRLCLPSDRTSDLDAALREMGVDPTSPRLGPADRQLMTIWWPGGAA